MKSRGMFSAAGNSWSKNSVSGDAAYQESRRDLEEPAHSLPFLRENSPLLGVILAAPRDPRVKFHAIIGDRGRNDAPAGGDGIVPVRSARYPGEVSEK